MSETSKPLYNSVGEHYANSDDDQTCPACSAAHATRLHDQGEIVRCFVCGGRMELLEGPDGSRRWQVPSGTIRPSGSNGTIR